MIRLLRGLLWLLLVLLLVLVGVFLYLRMSLPSIRGEVVLDGLAGQVEIVRDRYAVPHIYASSAEDAYFALGYVHAQDRLWQMEFQRRVGAGRLSEVVGDGALNTDRFTRTLGMYGHAERSVANLSPRVRGVLEAYVAGVNANLQSRRGPLPPEFLFFRHEPEPWVVADVLVWGKIMAYDLGGNWTEEIMRARLLQYMSRERVEQLWPPYPGEAPVVLPEFAALYDGLPLDSLWASSPKPLPPGQGSNAWVLSGEHTVTGMPLLANDPHLTLTAPSLWYFAHLTAPGLSVIGATLPGTPTVLLGRNDRIAWGFTNVGSDVQDLYVERLHPEDPNLYETPEGFEPFTVRTEVIRVKDAEDVTLEVRESRHGPIISDVSASGAEVAEAAGDRHVLALQWTALTSDDPTVQAVLNLNRAGNWTQFRDALRDFHAPHQNIVYADTEGNIGYYAAGRVPIRAKGEGLVPVPGWTGEYRWVGFVPFGELPHAFNPESGVIITANQKLVGDDYPHLLTHSWAEPYRSERIHELIGQLPQHSLASFARIQADDVSLMAREFLPVFLSINPELEQARVIQARLLGWDGSMARGQAEPLIFWVWYREFTRVVLEDELGHLFPDFWGARPMLMRSVLRDYPEWCNDIRTPGWETCEHQAAQAFRRAVAYLNETYGTNMDAWRWGEAHIALHAHRVFSGRIPAGIFDLEIENNGDNYTVDAARFNLRGDRPFVQTHGPGYRALYDLENLERSLYLHNTGQSGNPVSPHYRDFLLRWRNVSYVPMLTDRDELSEGALGTLTLLPR